ncbi:CxxxxCH/CxxCH domain-containing protein [Blautia wexlerae]|uniref:CxxxxCH/CxxCH domain-containing protein n=1 Tax=Blautia wexlerae TaxID=418240 RepID=A0A6L8XYM8_9FIRM|nr:CxxxxCH/CxxCH domain-containing protein [Ruminococcus sp.]MZS90922.1 CxxxxCH/CxxCH domain-containing protein [Blautia wexlerae]RHT11734.1 CxxxxCH/CxxCH domain-containing protein [Ruminococcus sp. AM34-9LB]MZS94647.1 CxxxxCH/CxxCH domain-containing protein [Blautia wexlerae]MZS98476.1 CxxxxCH/CxxCH domain-containing protein [Blautia wexlerae]
MRCNNKPPPFRLICSGGYCHARGQATAPGTVPVWVLPVPRFYT